MSKVNPVRTAVFGGAIGGFGAGCTILAMEEPRIKNFLVDSYSKAKTIPKDGTKLTLWQKTKDILKGTTNVINGIPQKIRSFVFNKEFKAHRIMLLGAIALGSICGLVSSLAIANHNKKQLKKTSSS